jgi:hypothetical protein
MKRNYLAIVTLILTSSLFLTSVQASITTYIWDNIHYVEGTGIDYPHPDRDYYDISISSDWTATGTKLYHNQFNHDTSEWVAGVGIIGVCTLIGLAVGAMTGTAEGAVIGGVVGVVLGLIAAGAGVVLKDECGCIWFWVSISFVDWLIDNAWWLGPLCIACPLLAQEEIMAAFLLYGYLRLGSGTIYDAIGAGNPTPQYTLSISASYGGTTNPACGTYTYDCGESVTVTATPDEDYEFVYWVLDDTIVWDNPTTITMDSDHDLETRFSPTSGGGGGGGCPTLFVWNGSGYVDYGVIDIHDVENDVVREVHVQAEDVSVAGYKVKFRLREGWEGLNYSHSLIDQVKLYAVDSEGNRLLCPLTKAEHSEQGKVLLKLLFSDDYRTDTYLMDTIDLTFVAPYPAETIENFTFTIEGHNPLKQ